MDYTELLQHSPYSWAQAEKEERILPLLQDLTNWHRQQCPKYGRALKLLDQVQGGYPTIDTIPFLPIRLFKQQSLQSIPDKDIFKTITSSGTSGQGRSHIVLDAQTAQNQQLTLYAIMKSFFGKQRLPMLIVDAPSVFRDRAAFNARGAAILGFSLFAKKKFYALTDTMDVDTASLNAFAQYAETQPVLIFGFTFMIWKYLCEALKTQGYAYDFSNAIVLHGGGWKKMADQAVSARTYKQRLYEQFHIRRVHNYYGMAEQTGCIYMECEYGHLHASIFSDVLIRNPADFSVCPPGQTGIIQVLSPIAASYPGHSILTEDMGAIEGIDDCPCGRKGTYFRIIGRIPQAEIKGCSDTHE